jgi:hypothetical protein
MLATRWQRSDRSLDWIQLIKTNPIKKNYNQAYIYPNRYWMGVAEAIQLRSGQANFYKIFLRAVFTGCAVFAAYSMAGDNRISCYAAERNKHFILEVLQSNVNDIIRVKRNSVTVDNNPPIRLLEIASGTGEHAGLFSEKIEDLLYLPTEPDLKMHDSIRSWTESSRGRVLQPLAFDVLQSFSSIDSVLPADFHNLNVDVMICINMIHISPYKCTEALFCLADKCLSLNSFLLTYGPYKINDQMVESNENFDRSLKARNPEWGIRDVEEITQSANKYGISLVRSVSMPANNMCLIFQRI